MNRGRKFALWVGIAIVACLGCGKRKDEQQRTLAPTRPDEPRPVLVANVALDGDILVEVDNRGFEHDQNCVQLVKFPQTGAETLRFLKTSCHATAPLADEYLLFSLQVAANDEVTWGSTRVGKFERLMDSTRLYDLCTRAYAGNCTLKFNGSRLIGVQ